LLLVNWINVVDDDDDLRVYKFSRV
jgi:hypothetical protein